MDVVATRTVLRMLSNGVYVLTARSSDRYGAATVTWISQISFKPQLIMAAVRRDSNVFKCLSESLAATVHVLAFNQTHLGQKFFAPTTIGAGEINGELFDDGLTGAPVLRNVPAYVECYVRHIVETGGDHALTVMEVVHAECRERVKPLTIADSPWQYGG